MKKNQLKYFLFSLPLFFLSFPTPTLAQGANFFLAGSNFKDFILYIISIIATLIPILSGLAFLVFFWGLSKFILNSSSPADIAKGRNYMIWGILALFVLLSFRTIIGFVVADLEFGDANNAPQLNTGSNN